MYYMCGLYEMMSLPNGFDALQVNISPPIVLTHLFPSSLPFSSRPFEFSPSLPFPLSSRPLPLSSLPTPSPLPLTHRP